MLALFDNRCNLSVCSCMYRYTHMYLGVSTVFHFALDRSFTDIIYIFLFENTKNSISFSFLFFLLKFFFLNKINNFKSYGFRINFRFENIILFYFFVVKLVFTEYTKTDRTKYLCVRSFYFVEVTAKERSKKKNEENLSRARATNKNLGRKKNLVQM